MERHYCRSPGVYTFLLLSGGTATESRRDVVVVVHTNWYNIRDMPRTTIHRTVTVETLKNKRTYYDMVFFFFFVASLCDAGAAATGDGERAT